MAKGNNVVYLFSLLLLVSVFTFVVTLDTASAYRDDDAQIENLRYSVQGRLNWTNTLQTVKPGEILTFEATGNARPNKVADLSGPMGKDGVSTVAFPCEKAPAYSVVAKIGESGSCFLIGDYLQIEPKKTGFLWLAYNDDNLDDNTGVFKVSLTIDRTCPGCETVAEREARFEQEIKDAVTSFYRARQNNNFGTLTDMTTGDIESYYLALRIFQEKFDDENEDGQHTNELLPQESFDNLVVTIDDYNQDLADVTVAADQIDEATLRLEKERGQWKIIDAVEDGDDLADREIDNIEFDTYIASLFGDNVDAPEADVADDAEEQTETPSQSEESSSSENEQESDTLTNDDAADSNTSEESQDSSSLGFLWWLIPLLLVVIAATTFLVLKKKGKLHMHMPHMSHGNKRKKQAPIQLEIEGLSNSHDDSADDESFTSSAATSRASKRDDKHTKHAHTHKHSKSKAKKDEKIVLYKPEKKTKKCHSCGHRMDEDLLYCPECGTKQ